MAEFSLKMYSSPFAVRKWTLRSFHFQSFTTLYNSSVTKIKYEIKNLDYFSTTAHHYYELTLQVYKEIANIIATSALMRLPVDVCMKWGNDAFQFKTNNHYKNSSRYKIIKYKLYM